MNNNAYVAIMAGGIGSRFWPKSREAMPKQFLDILGTGETLIQATFKRFQKIVPTDHIYIVSNEKYTPLIKEQIPDIKDEQIVAEPIRRNTAPCVALMAYKLAALNPNACFVIAPSDHLIVETDEFAKYINKALDFATNKDALLTLGIKPHRPHTGYGYIQYDDETCTVDGICKVRTFTEKPSAELASSFIESGDFLWNAGIFIWHNRSIIKAFETHQPDIAEVFAEGKSQYNTYQEQAFIDKAYKLCPNISIDYAIMEYAQNVYTIPSNFGWSDLGTWLSLWEQHSRDFLGNAVSGDNVIMYDTENCLIDAPKDKLVIIQGLPNYCCVIDSGDVLLVARLKDEAKLKEIHNEVKRETGKKYF